MLLTLIKRAVKSTLHEATEEWMLETGLYHQDVAELRARRIALAAQIEAHTDAQAAVSLGDEDEEEQHTPLALPMPSAARTTGPDNSTAKLVSAPEASVEDDQEQRHDGDAGSDVADDADLMVWVEYRR